MYVKNYSSAISTDDYISLIKVIQSLVTCNTNVNWDVVQELACLVLGKVTSHTSCQMEDCDQNVSSLWSSCVRQVYMNIYEGGA